MKLRISHRTEYRYALPARNNSNELHLQPAQTESQEPKMFLLRILPATRVRRSLDFHGAWIHSFEIEEPHDRLVIESQCRIVTTSRYASGEPMGVDHQTLSLMVQDDELHPF